MAVYSYVPYINPAEKMAEANTLVSQAQADNAFAEQLMQMAIVGHGDQDAARQLLATVRSLMGEARINQEFWNQVAKDALGEMKKVNELIKSN